MNRLFEQFVTQLLISAARQWISIDPKFGLDLGEDEKVQMYPDIVIRDRGLPVAVADCKYKRTDPEVYKNHDYYQVLSYCIAAGVHRGLLIYPLDETVTNDNVQVRNTRITIEQLTINLGLPFQDFRRECQHFAEQVLSSAVQSQLQESA